MIMFRLNKYVRNDGAVFISIKNLFSLRGDNDYGRVFIDSIYPDGYRKKINLNKKNFKNWNNAIEQAKKGKSEKINDLFLEEIGVLIPESSPVYGGQYLT